jgi:hypothetical protein
LDGQIKENEMGTYGRKKKCIRGVVGYLEDKRELGRDGTRFEDNIK